MLGWRVSLTSNYALTDSVWSPEMYVVSQIRRESDQTICRRDEWCIVRVTTIFCQLGLAWPVAPSNQGSHCTKLYQIQPVAAYLNCHRIVPSKIWLWCKFYWYIDILLYFIWRKEKTHQSATEIPTRRRYLIEIFSWSVSLTFTDVLTNVF